MRSGSDCTIVILSYNSLGVTDICLSKVRDAMTNCIETLGNDIRVVVVDNGSKDGSADMIREKYPFVDLIALDENIGYAAGNNLAMKTADTPYILLMNSDTYIERDSILKSMRKMEKGKGMFDVLVSRWTTDDGVFHNYGGHLPTPTRIILWALGFESYPIIRNFLRKIYSYNSVFYDREGFMQWCPPCFMLIKRKVYSLTGGFDEKLWFHMVDVEWCKRMREKGLNIFFTPEIEVIHLGGASSKGMDESLMSDNFKGLMHYCRKHFPSDVRTVAIAVKFGLRIRSILYFLMGKRNLAATYGKISTEVKC